jgi:hypothetical protein
MTGGSQPVDKFPGTGRVPHVRPSVRGPKKISSTALTIGLTTKPRVPHTPDFLWSLVGSASFMRLSLEERRTSIPVESRVQEIRGISLVFREMWDTTAHNGQPFKVEDERSRFVVSHISRKTSEIWGTRGSLSGQSCL